jgi:two-component system cell cycle response regulator
MSARVLIVDDSATNRAVLELHLNAEYFDAIQASNGPEALALCGQGDCDIVLLDLNMPEMNGIEVCRRLRVDPLTHHLPIVVVSADPRTSEKLRALEAGADDVLSKPVDEAYLTKRLRALARTKVTLDELRLRAVTSTALGMPDPVLAAISENVAGASILLVEDRTSVALQIKAAFEPTYQVDIEHDPQEALFKGVEGRYDLFLVSLGLQGYDGLRICSQFRALERTRHIPILTMADVQDEARVLRGLDIGVDDTLMRPIDRNELRVRVRNQLRRKRYADSLRDNVRASIEMAVVDTLTGLNNRRFFDSNYAACVDQAARKGRPLSLMLLDIDFFKRVNDTHGHDAGDQILKIFAARIRRVVRGSDLVCRLGGEEFGILMPDTSIEIAHKIAERVRSAVEKELFAYAPDRSPIPITTSIGLAGRRSGDNAEQLMRRADDALYRSKDSGRNRVTADAA